MPNPAILRVAEDERRRAEATLDAHYDMCTIWPQEACLTCRKLAEAAARAGRDLAVLRWKQALADEARAKRNRRGRRPVPAITGVRIPPPSTRAT